MSSMPPHSFDRGLLVTAAGLVTTRHPNLDPASDNFADEVIAQMKMLAQIEQRVNCRLERARRADAVE